jgi:hypothetical protein
MKKKNQCRFPCAFHPFTFQAMSLWFVGLGRGVLKAIWDKNQLFLKKTFILRMYKVEHPYPTVTSQSISDSNQPGSVQLGKEYA